jgi:hypothetical protein
MQEYFVAPRAIAAAMALPAISQPAPAPIPVSELLPYAILGGLLFLLLIYFIGAEQGAMSLIGGHYIHEFVHDGRHLMGFPCH